MDAKIEVYLHMEGKRNPNLVKISSDKTFGQLLVSTGDIDKANVEEWSIMVDGSDENPTPDKLLNDAGIKNRSHVHCYRCKKVEVTVMFNGRDIKNEFPPSAKAKRVLQWAIREFGISSDEATDYVLVLEDETELNDRDRIGMYVDSPNCQIVLILTREQAING